MVIPDGKGALYCLATDEVRLSRLRAVIPAGIWHIGTHAFRHTYRSLLDAVGTPIAVKQKMMRHTDIRTTMNIYGDIVTDEMTTASGKVAQLAFRPNGAQTERKEG
jgi:integrase